MSANHQSQDPKNHTFHPVVDFLNQLPSFLWQDNLKNAFWRTITVLSFVVNMILIIVVILGARELFALKSVVEDQLIGGLTENFRDMDRARIQASIGVEDEISVQFDLPVQTTTNVVLQENVRLTAPVKINTPYVSINAPADIQLPKGLELPISLDIVVPVDASVPISLQVPVDIPIAETELHEPFLGLQNVLAPYQKMLISAPDSWEEVLFCKNTPGCMLLLGP
jgi:hypothetical protein